jgi:predicted TPR repeat methyltransferase
MSFVPDTNLRHASGHPLADRRYDYAMTTRQDGDHAACADLLEQALELAPQWAAGWFALGESREALNEPDAAARAFEKALELNPSDDLGAGLRLARLHGATPVTAPAEYVRALFDQYAPKFDAHLVGALTYRAPELLRDALIETSGEDARFAHALDLGCGTGLAAIALRDRVTRFSGVDLSPAMVEKARQTGLYERLSAGDLVEFITALPSACSDLVIAADVFVYMGDLSATFAQTARVLTSGGIFCFTVQSLEACDFALGEDLRFGHSADYIDKQADTNGFAVKVLRPQSTRKDRGCDVPGLLVVLEKP